MTSRESLCLALLLLLAAPGCDSDHRSSGAASDPETLKLQAFENLPENFREVEVEIERERERLRLFHLRDFRRVPPRVASMTAQLLQKPQPVVKALLRVRFEQGERVPPRLLVHLDEGDRLLRDDGHRGDEHAGDGVYSVVLDLDLARLERNQQMYLQDGQGPQTRVPIFEDRVLKGDAPPRWIDFSALRRGDVIAFPDIPLSPGGVNAAASLFIRHLAVVEDPARTYDPCSGVGTPLGKWTFGYLVTQMANTAVTGVQPADLARSLLDEIDRSRTINGWPVSGGRAQTARILEGWEAASGGPGMPLDVSKAPFKLLAIVNRIDLAENLVYGGGSAGELRFVFGPVDLARDCFAEDFPIILEYGVRKSDCEALRAWALEWMNLSSLTVGSATYNAALEALVDPVVRANAAPSRPNGSALNQLRTNQHPVVGLWELREFRISPVTGLFTGTTVAQTPASDLQDSDRLADFINSSEAELLDGTALVPLRYPFLEPFRGAVAPISPAFVLWDFSAARVPNREALQKFAGNTCNGCHLRETATSFNHIKVAPFGSVAELSPFLTGVTVPDPRDGAPTRTFNDLLRRRLKLVNLAHKSCFELLRDIPTLSVH
jgi:hypothetical protein